VFGGGAAVLGMGVVLGLHAQTLHDRANAEPVQLTAETLQADAEVDVQRANGAFIVGGVIAAAGVGWGIGHILSRSPGGQVQVALGPGTLALRGTFP
jgi:hypothetical protein